MTGYNIRGHKTKGNVMTARSFSNIGEFARCGRGNKSPRILLGLH